MPAPSTPFEYELPARCPDNSPRPGPSGFKHRCFLDAGHPGQHVHAEGGAWPNSRFPSAEGA